MNNKSYCIQKLFLIIFISFSTLLAGYQVSLVQERGEEVSLHFSMSESDYEIVPIDVNGEKCDLVALPNAAYDEEKGFPHVPRVAQSMIIPDLPKMQLVIVAVQYKDIKVNTLAPSKGSFSRKINPADVPYEFGDVYQKDGWFPSQCAKLGTPYIARDFRANVVYFQPFIFNAKSKTLRIYSEITVKVSPTSEIGINVKKRVKPLTICPAYHQIYSRRFINYSTQRYTPVDEEGTMLIISYGDFMTAMEPFVEWKNRRGIKTEMVDVADVGSSAQSITTYVADYYNNKELKYLLLVGDVQQVPTSSSSGDPSDNKYVCIEGNDSYVEAFAGRFSGTTTAHIQTQVDKVLHYERELGSSDTWLNKGYGTYSSSEQDDKDAIAHIKTDLEGFTYTTVNTGGSEEKVRDLIGDIGSGIGLHINSSHGSKTSIAGLRTTNVPTLNNDGMYPFNFTLACNPGEFDGSGDCLGEAVVKKEGGGYIGAFMASISQPWYEPYAGIHEHTDILTESYPDNIKRTYGGIAHNGCMKMIDDYSNQGPWVSDCWVLFGDPSLLVYTDTPKPITINHPSEVGSGAQDIVVSGTEDATVCLYSPGQNIQEVKKLAGGQATFTIEVTTADDIFVTGTAFNYETYEGVIKVVLGPYIAISSPMTGDVFWAGDEVTIAWDTGGGANVSEVRLDYSTDNGSTYSSIVSSITNTGSHKWTVPDVNESDQCVIKVTDLTGNLEDESGIFTIKQKAHILLDQNAFDVGLRPGMTMDKKLKISNTGKGKLSYSVSMVGGGNILINELYVSESATYDGFEIWNQGTEADLSGWKLQWNDNQNTSGSYTFPSGTTLKAGGTLVFMDQQDQANDSTIYSGSNLYWDVNTTELSIAILDKDGQGVDFVRSSGNNDSPPAGTEWNGTGVPLSNDYVYRNRNRDNDDASDWTAAATGTQNSINPGQSQTSGHWLSVNPNEGTVDPLSNLEITVSFNAQNVADGVYYDTLFIEHNDPDEQSPVVVPCKFTVNPNVAILDGLHKNLPLFSIKHIAGKGTVGIVHFNINAPDAKKELRIFDCLGNLVYEDNQGDIEPWYFTNGRGAKVASGVYFIVLKLKYKDHTQTFHKSLVGVK